MGVCYLLLKDTIESGHSNTIYLSHRNNNSKFVTIHTLNRHNYEC